MNDGRLKNTTLLSAGISILLLGLGLILITSDRSISRIMESCGDFLSQALGM